MNKAILSISVITLVSISLFHSCKKEDPTPTPAATCSDGIQNQGETGIDCGGPCTPCSNTLCEGNGTNAYLPLAVNNTWTYFRDVTGYPDETSTETITGTQVLSNSKTYFVLDYGAKQGYFRVDSIGDIYAWKTNSFNQLGAGESFFLPANPTVGQYWKDEYFIPDSFVVKSTSADITSTNGCSYTGLLKIDVYSLGSFYETQYFKQGIGRVHETSYGFYSYTEHLNTVTLN